MQFIRILLISVLMKQHATFIIPKESLKSLMNKSVLLYMPSLMQVPFWYLQRRLL
nr:MAG TPA: hypothetical protein [Bacteriophage sp.]